MRAINERLKQGRHAIDHRFHAPVAPVAHPAGEAQGQRLVEYPLPVAHPLDAPGDDQVPCHGSVHAYGMPNAARAASVRKDSMVATQKRMIGRTNRDTPMAMCNQSFRVTP